jgi:hypothetical protein
MKRQLFCLGVTTAIAVAVSLTLMSGAAAQDAAPASAVPTPRMPDGKPDLSGMWAGGGGGGGRQFDELGTISSATASRRCAPGQRKCDEHTNQSFDQEFVREDTVNGEVIFSGRWDPNRPLYKPEFWDRIQYLDENTNTEDPILKCQPQGITREGPPTKIVQTAREIIFFYGGDYFRIIPIDGRKHDPSDFSDITFWGHAVGQWEGDTLVVDAVGFNDLTWLARGGYFHSDTMHVVERFRREGNVLRYEVTVEDKEVLLQPWVVAPRRLRLNTNPKASIPEGEPCRDYDSENLVTKIRH